LAKVKKIEKELNSNNFFSNDNKIILEGQADPINKDDLKTLI
jgi:hypothetical protein